MTAVATSNVVAFDAPLAPAQAHLALTANPDQMSLIWVSGDNGSQPIVQYLLYLLVMV